MLLLMLVMTCPFGTPTTMHSLMHHNHHKAKTNLDQNLNANKLTRATTLTRPPYHQSYLVLPMFVVESQLVVVCTFHAAGSQS
jgi:hypothetical protein